MLCIIEYKTSIEVSILYRAFSSYFLTILLNELLSDTRDYDEPEILFCLPIDKRNKRGSVKVLLEVRTVGPDYGEPARICGCLDYVTVTPKVAFKRPCMQSTISHPCCVFTFLIAPACYQMISDTTMPFSVMLGKLHCVLSKIQGSMELKSYHSL